MPALLRILALRLTNNTKVSLRAKVRGMENIVFGRSVRVADDCHMDARKGRITIGDNVTISPFVVVEARGGSVEIGEGASINSFCVLYGHGGLRIGRDCIIAAKSTFIPANHIFDSIDSPIKEQGETARGITIGDDVWIGTNATVLDGVTIGRGSVIGAGSVVTGDIPPYSVAVGVPARVIRSRKG